MSTIEPVLRRRFAMVRGRRVHYLRLGEGPPAVLVHSSPINAWYVVPHMRLLADRFTCFAFDSPGFGSSDALPGDTLTVGDLSDALAENMRAIGLPACPVFGTHSGAAIALSLAAHRPERVTALMIDGLPVFTPDEQADLFADYFQPLEIDALGGHFSRTWTRFRDQYVWFPWTRKMVANHNESDLGTPEAINLWVNSFFYAGRTYKPAYRAACFYGDEAYADAKAVRCPVTYTATESDMLYPHLDRLLALPLPVSQEVRRIGNDKTGKDRLIAEVFDRWTAASAMRPDHFALVDGPGIRQQFVDLDHGQILLRHAGPLDAPAILVLHDAPGSGHNVAEAAGLVAALSTSHLVLIPDLPGCGESDPLPADESSLTAWVDAVAAVCIQARIERVCVYGIGVGASIALGIARRHPSLVDAVVIRGLALPEPDERAELRARYAPPLTVDADGSHWYRTWLMLRDQQIWFPWYDRRAARLRRVQGDFGADHLHRWTFEVQKQHAHYHRVIDAVFDDDAAASLAEVRIPLAICGDPQVPFFAYDQRLRALRPDAVSLPVDASSHATSIATFLRGTPALRAGGRR